MLRTIQLFALASLLFAGPAGALQPQPGDVYFVARTATGVEVHHVAGATGATTLVARDGHIDDTFTCCLTVAADGKIWLAQEPDFGPTGKLVRIDPTAFDPGNASANQQLVLQNALLVDVDDIAAVPPPFAAAVAAVSPWLAALGGAAILLLYAVRRPLRVARG